MSVTKGHMLISVLPTYAGKETTHGQVYMHEDEPYDPPTFVNNVLYNCTNRPNANTPTAYPMFGLPSWKDEKDKQTIIQEFHRSI
jgi:hypothetical protein